MSAFTVEPKARLITAAASALVSLDCGSSFPLPLPCKRPLLTAACTASADQPVGKSTNSDAKAASMSEDGIMLSMSSSVISHAVVLFIIFIPLILLIAIFIYQV